MPRPALILLLAFFALLTSFVPSSARAQAPSPATPQFATAAPKVLLLVYQQFVAGKSATRQNLEVDVARTFDRMASPVTWIELESLTGPSQALFIDPASSFADIEKAGGALGQLYATRTDLAQSQQQIDDLVSNARTVSSILRDDLSMNANSLNLGKARYLRIRTVQVRPEHERDFVNALTASHTQNPTAAQSAAVYQVNAGLPDLTFIFIEPMRSMQDIDQNLTATTLAPLALAISSEVNLFAVHPEMSHVGKDFAAADPRFWMQAPAQ
jgi:hypothetical protein